MPAQPALGLHANRYHGVPTCNSPGVGYGSGRCISRTNILTGEVPCAIGYGQNPEVFTTGLNKNDPSHWPKKWLKAGSVLRVPKAAILSSCPQWTLMWEMSYFLGPRDVIGQMGTAPFLFGNYYYFDQWDGELLTDERFTRKIGSAASPYPHVHQSLLESFRIAAEALASDPLDPIYCIIPKWVPPRLAETGNDFLTLSHENLNAAHGGAINFQPCEVADSVPCYNYEPVRWSPEYPDARLTANNLDFVSCTVPWLPSVSPGFGLATVHLYSGHCNMKYAPSNILFDWQAWPLTPEVQWIAGPIFASTWIGSPLPFFAGRRLVWKDQGYDYGYTGTITPQGLYATRYGPNIVAPAANNFKDVFYYFRNFSARHRKYAESVDPAFDLGAIQKDQERTCPATQFYLGWENFSDFASTYDNEDNTIVDCSGKPPHLKYGETMNNFPLSEDIRTATNVFYPPIQKRVEDYYNSINGGSFEFITIAWDRNGLVQPRYDFLCDGLPAESWIDPDYVTAHLRSFFTPYPAPSSGDEG